MKKILLFLIFLSTIIITQAQCTPDPQYIVPGIYPDTATGLSDAVAGQSYNELITIIVPVDTAVDFNGIPITATFSSIELTNVTGLPPNFTYTCDPSSCEFPGGTTKCAEVYSTTNPTILDVGVYPITFECVAHLTAPLVGQVDCTYVESGYSIEIIDNTTSVLHYSDAHIFKLYDITPNPINDYAEVRFTSGESKQITLTVYNLLGKQVLLRKINANRGINTINIDVSELPNGLYMYSLNNREQLLTKTMFVTH